MSASFAQTGTTTRVNALPFLERAYAQAAAGDWEHASSQLEAFTMRWHMDSHPTSRQSQDVESALNGAARAMLGAGTAPERVPDSFEALSKALIAYRESTGASELQPDGEQFFGSLAEAAARSLDFLQDSRPARAAAALRLLDALWSLGEDAEHAKDPQRYAAVEAGVDGGIAVLQASPPDLSRARDAVAGLLTALNAAVGNGTPSASVPAGSTNAGSAPGIADLIARLKGVRESLTQGDAREAIDRMQGFIAAWPLAEGAVKTRSEDAYRQTEEDMSAADGLLLSGPGGRARADARLNAMIERLSRLEQTGSDYTVWDAGLILLREGLEALLVLAALLAMLRKSGARVGEGWVWSGAAVGLLASCLLAVVLVFAVSQAAAGGARESLEGYVGIASVALMVTVGAWLHRRSSLQSWNAFIKGRVGGALAAGSMWSLFVLALVSVLREGAESVVFYIGIAGSIPLERLLAGIGGAIVLLVVIGFLIIRFSVRLPLHWFFLVATLLIYYLAFKIAGESVHSLQVAGAIPSHEVSGLPSVPALGMFRSWETLVPQAVVLLLVLAEMLVTEIRRLIGRRAEAAAETTTAKSAAPPASARQPF